MSKEKIIALCILIGIILIYFTYKIMCSIKNTKEIKNKQESTKSNFIKPKLEFKEGHMEIVTRWVNGEITADQAANELQISRSSLYNYFGDLKREKKQSGKTHGDYTCM